MDAASAFGSADFYRDVQEQITHVRKLESSPWFKTLLLKCTVYVGRFGEKILTRMTDFAVFKLVAKSTNLKKAAIDLESKYDSFLERTARGVDLPFQDLADSFQQSRAKTLELVAIGLKNKSTLREIGADARLVREFDNLINAATLLEVTIARFEEVAVAALACPTQLQTSRELSAGFEQMMANLGKTDLLPDDPELEAAAKTAIQRVAAAAH